MRNYIPYYIIVICCFFASFQEVKAQSDIFARDSIGYSLLNDSAIVKNRYEGRNMLLKCRTQLEALAQQGNQKATLLLADHYYEGCYNDFPDYKKAMALYEKLADDGNADAMCGLANCLKYGSTRNGITTALDLYNKAMDKGCLKAKYEIADCIEKGYGMPKDLVKACAMYYDVATDTHDKKATRDYVRLRRAEKIVGTWIIDNISQDSSYTEKAIITFSPDGTMTCTSSFKADLSNKRQVDQSFTAKGKWTINDYTVSMECKREDIDIIRYRSGLRYNLYNDMDRYQINTLSLVSRNIFTDYKYVNAKTLRSKNEMQLTMIKQEATE